MNCKTATVGSFGSLIPAWTVGPDGVGVVEAVVAVVAGALFVFELDPHATSPDARAKPSAAMAMVRVLMCPPVR
jgi:hypothetical protein